MREAPWLDPRRVPERELLQHHHAPSLPGERVGGREPIDAGSDDRDVGLGRQRSPDWGPLKTTRSASCS